MTRHLLAACVAAACLVAGTGCTDKRTTKPTGGGGAGDVTVNPGTPLFSYGPFRPAKAEGHTNDPITVPMANVVILRKLDLPSRVDGTVLWIGVETTVEDARRLNPADVFTHPRDKKVYRRLQPGDLVKRDQVIAMLDDEQAYLEYQGADAKAKAAGESAKASEKTVVKLQQVVEQERLGAIQKTVPLQELYSQEATLARYQSELVEHQGTAVVAVKDAEKAKYVWDRHFLKPAVDGEVQQVLKHEGEGVKAGQEPLLTVYDFAKLRAVGNLPKEYVTAIGHGDEVTIEVTQDIAYGPTFEQHTTNRPIVAVAVGVANGKPVIVSAGEDGWVYAWDRDLKVLGAWRQANGVRSLAVTRPDAGAALALVGGVNGTAMVYDLANPSAAGREFDGRHDGGVAAAAFSPDGKYCVTADERAIFMYDVSTGKRKYTFPTREHHSSITSLSFTPQGKVVSVGREPSVRVWTVGQDGAKVEHGIDSRSGDVTTLSVTDDGSRLLLDADKTRLDVIHLQELRKERPLMTAGEAGRFTTFAAWSPDLDKKPDNRRIATTGGTEGVVELWLAPTQDARGAEVARFVTRGLAAATCAAFSPQGENGFLVVGTRKGDVHLWSLPTGAGAQNEIRSTVTFVEPNIESSGRTVNVLVDFDNPKLGDKHLLRPGSAVTLVIRPRK
jgi:HlyD family secretion protein/WD domain, G-beta repeat